MRGGASSLPPAVLQELRGVLGGCDDVLAAYVVERPGERTNLVFELVAVPDDIVAYRALIHELVAAVAPALGEYAQAVSFGTGPTDAIGAITQNGVMVYARGESA